MRMRRRGRLWVPEAPQLMLNRHRPIRGLGQRIGVSGEWSLELIHARTGDVTQSFKFPNLITNVGLDALSGEFPNGLFNALSDSAQYSVFSRCFVGTGNAEPAITDSELQNPIANTSNTGGFGFETGLVDNNTRCRYRKTWVFGTSEANGNIAEVGCGVNHGSNPFNGTVFTRQLIRDALGEPTVLVKTSEYQLRVVYELSLWLPLGDQVYEMNINGATVEVVSRLESLAYWNRTHGLVSGESQYGLSTQPIGPEGSNLSGTVASDNSLTTRSTYVPGTYQVEWEGIWGPSSANGGPYISFSSRYSTAGSPSRTFKVDLSNAPGGGVSKTSDERFVVEWTRSWGRHEA